MTIHPTDTTHRALQRAAAHQDSPLAMLVQDERTNRLFADLSAHLAALRATAPGEEPPVLVLERDLIDACRTTWEAGVLRGEQRLYDLATLLARTVTGADTLQRVARVIMGSHPESEDHGNKRIIIEESVSEDELKRVSDRTLSQRIARRYRYRAAHDQPFDWLYAVASFLEYLPLSAEDGAPATRVMTRVKTNDQIWNKVGDALFSVDTILKRDKILNARSKYIKDVFGIKILTPRRPDSYRVHELLSTLKWSPDKLTRLGLEPTPDRLSLELVEHKDYLSLPEDQKKRTGWEAIKNVYRWGGQLFEVQIQTEANFFLESMHLTDTSHATFEQQRRAMRRHFEENVPHYAEYRRLLKAIFRYDDDQALKKLDDVLPWLKIKGL